VELHGAGSDRFPVEPGQQQQASRIDELAGRGGDADVRVEAAVEAGVELLEVGTEARGGSITVRVLHLDSHRPRGE
jgi:hypothetical protein